MNIDYLQFIEDIENAIDDEQIRLAWAEQGDKPPVSWEIVKKRLGLEVECKE